MSYECICNFKFITFLKFYIGMRALENDLLYWCLKPHLTVNSLLGLTSHVRNIAGGKRGFLRKHSQLSTTATEVSEARTPRWNLLMCSRIINQYEWIWSYALMSWILMKLLGSRWSLGSVILIPCFFLPHWSSPMGMNLVWIWRSLNLKLGS